MPRSKIPARTDNTVQDTTFDRGRKGIYLFSTSARLRSSFLVQFFCELSCPNRREFIRKFFEFAPRGALQARIPGDFSPFERNRASVFAETLLFNVASAVSRAASLLH
jgi:hypothetical protein